MDFVLASPTSSRLRSVAAPETRTSTPTSRPAPAARVVEPAASKPSTAQDVFQKKVEPQPRGLAGVDRRWSPRTKLGKSGWIGVAHREEPVACTVCDISKHGAMLELATIDALGRPSERHCDTFVLVWMTNRVRSEATCTVRWRSAKFIGVNFAGPVRTSVDRR